MGKQLLTIIGAGHGGFVKDSKGELIYITAPSKMYDHGENGIAYEGEHTRRIANELSLKLQLTGRPFCYLNSNLDYPLYNRVRVVNDIYETYKSEYNILYIPIHLNAGKGTGFEVWTSPGQTKSDRYAELLIEEIEIMFPEHKIRLDTTDGDGDKESMFYELVKTKCPAILPELLFFDNAKDYKYIKSYEYPHDMSNLLFEFIRKAETQIQ